MHSRSRAARRRGKDRLSDSRRGVEAEGDARGYHLSAPCNQRTLTVHVGMRRAGTAWKVERIENLAAVPEVGRVLDSA